MSTAYAAGPARHTTTATAAATPKQHEQRLASSSPASAVRSRLRPIESMLRRWERSLRSG
ncbi:hypothetical protein [Nonomuraea dietziae]|uniref:hypothetical protein n=1 Tax=Nonomuraea dietziae TaxID=65515 RepID=UPI003449BF2E